MLTTVFLLYWTASNSKVNSPCLSLSVALGSKKPLHQPTDQQTEMGENPYLSNQSVVFYVNSSAVINGWQCNSDADWS